MLYMCFLGTLFGCKKIDENGFRIYTIKKDKHRSGYRYCTTKENKFKLEVIFDESAIYQTQDTLNQYDVNKLWGVSDCGTNHMENSIRFGWRWLNDNLEIHWFQHENGDFYFAKIKDVEINEIINLELEITDSDYIISVDGVTKTISRNCNKKRKKYKLYPYFGGDETAPHDVKILIKEI